MEYWYQCVKINLLVATWVWYYLASCRNMLQNFKSYKVWNNIQNWSMYTALLNEKSFMKVAWIPKYGMLLVTLPHIKNRDKMWWEKGSGEIRWLILALPTRPVISISSVGYRSRLICVETVVGVCKMCLHSNTSWIGGDKWLAVNIAVGAALHCVLGCSLPPLIQEIRMRFGKCCACVEYQTSVWACVISFAHISTDVYE